MLDLSKSNIERIKKRMVKFFDVDFNSIQVNFFKLAVIKVSWSYSGSDFLYGGVEINGISECLILKSDFWKIDFSLAPDAEVPESLKHFEKLNWYTVINLSLEEYFDAMFASCAVCGWQYFYIDYNQDIPHLDKALKDMEVAVKFLPKLFPEKDFSYHSSKLQELKRIKGL